MKSEDEMTIDHNPGISRREILKAASAITAAGLAVGLPEVALAAPPAGVEYTRTTPLNEKNVYPLLAAWLILTTKGPTSELAIPSSLGSVAGLGPNTYGDIYNTYFHDSPNVCKCPHCSCVCDTSYSAAFNRVRTAFSTLAKAYAYGTIPYTNGICPDHASLVAAIASLPCPVCPPRAPAAKE